jgi:hypothetical protein
MKRFLREHLSTAAPSFEGQFSPKGAKTFCYEKSFTKMEDENPLVTPVLLRRCAGTESDVCEQATCDKVRGEALHAKAA